MLSPILEAISKKSIKIKKTETLLPIVKMKAMVDCLSIGDDLSIRTSVSSPATYDKDLVKLIRKHTELIDQDTNTINLEYNQFVENLSHSDKLSLIWALYRSTYETIARGRIITCPHCRSENKIDVYLDELIHEDTYYLWEEAESFKTFRFIIEIEHSGVKFTFRTKMPSIADRIRMLNTITTGELQNNLEKLGTPLPTTHQMAIVIDGLAMTWLDNSTPSIETTHLQEILMALDQLVPHPVANKFFKKYSEKFDKYIPNFYKQVTCTSCGASFKYEVELEIEFYRSILTNNAEAELVDDLA